jgi:predicted nucleic acid-binding protein
VTPAAVSDAGPLIHLAEIDSLELLSTFDTLLVPETVYEEVDAGGVPAVAKERGVVLLTDDLAARETASDAGVEVRGSIGVIALGYGRGLLDRDEAASRMRALQRETSLFVTEAVVERGIQMLDEQ